MNALIVLNSLKLIGQLKSIAQDTARKPRGADEKALKSLVLIIQQLMSKFVLDVRKSLQPLSQTKLIVTQRVLNFIEVCENAILK
jgi:hypothetical protein